MGAPGPVLTERSAVPTDFFNSILGFLRMLTGENWNNIMHDAAIEAPYCVENNGNFLLTDCGSPSWYANQMLPVS